MSIQTYISTSTVKQFFHENKIIIITLLFILFSLRGCEGQLSTECPPKCTGLDLRGKDQSESNFSGVHLEGAIMRRSTWWKANLSDTDLTGADLSKANLTGSNLERSTLHATNMQETTLVGVKLRHADMNGANLDGAHLNGVDLTGTVLNAVNLGNAQMVGINMYQVTTNAGFSNANLTGSNLQCANLSASIANRANLNGANMKNTKLVGASFIQADLSGVDLTSVKPDDDCLNKSSDDCPDEPCTQSTDMTGVNLTDAIVRGANMQTITMKGAFLIRADLSGSDMSGSNMSDSDLSDAILIGTNMQGITLTNAILGGVQMDGANLSYVNMSDASLVRLQHKNGNRNGDSTNSSSNAQNGYTASMSTPTPSQDATSSNAADEPYAGVSASLRGTNMQHAILDRVNLEKADLSDADIQHARLAEANLRDTILVGANLQGSVLTNAILSGADLTGADLRGADLHGAIWFDLKYNTIPEPGKDSIEVRIPGEKIASMPIQDFVKHVSISQSMLFEKLNIDARFYSESSTIGDILRSNKMTLGQLEQKIELPEKYMIRANLADVQGDEKTIWPEGYQDSE